MRKFFSWYIPVIATCLAVLLATASCGAAISVGFGDDDDYYYRPRNYFAIDPYYLYDGYWNDGYCYYRNGWYYRGYDTPYDYMYDPYDPFYW